MGTLEDNESKMSEYICNKIESTAAYQTSHMDTVVNGTNVTKRNGMMSPRLVIVTSENMVTCRKEQRPENFVVSSLMRLVTLRTTENQAFLPVLDSMKNITERGSKEGEQQEEDKIVLEQYGDQE